MVYVVADRAWESEDARGDGAVKPHRLNLPSGDRILGAVSVDSAATAVPSCKLPFTS